VVGNVLYVAAHPDDENTQLLAYLGNETQVRAAYLSLTRGDGGQNLLGAEQGPLLGLIRTQELLAARRIDGAEQFFTRARDFGFSKSPDETLQIWGREPILADVVWAIRRFRPDVIVTRFPTGGIETHGHHTASAMLAVEAFKAAADPNFHPEQLKYVTPWQAKRIVWNKSSFFIKSGEDLSGYLKMDINVYNPMLGISYGEMAAASRSMHKSQGFGAAPPRKPTPEYFQLLAGDPMKQSFLDGIDLSWGRVKGAEKLAETLRRARSEFKPENPAATIPLLNQAAAELQALRDNPWKAEKLGELNDLTAACAGLYLEATANDSSVVPGAELAITATAIDRSTAKVKVDEIKLPGSVVVSGGKELAKEEPLVAEKNVTIPATMPYSDPYWLVDPPEPGLYPARDATQIGLPELPPALIAEFALTVGGRSFSLTRPVLYKWTDPVAGERTRPVEVAPPVTVNASSSVLMFPDNQSHSLKLVVKATAANVSGTLKPELPAGFTATPASLPIHLEGKGTEEEVTFKIHPPAHAATGIFRAVVEIGDQKIARSVRRIDYPHIPIQTVFPPAEIKLVRFDHQRTKTRIGYIPGAGDEVAAALQQVGYDVTPLNDEMLRTDSLSRFEAIVIGVRAFNTDATLPFRHKKLMDYVASGGTVVAQYNTNNWISKVPTEIGPYPFQISRDRVTDENATVEMVHPDHPAVTRPNKLSPADFEHWVQERGLYFATKWDDKYTPLFSIKDPGEPASQGSTIVAKYGKGAFIYTGLAFFRQLPAGVTGAYRLFSNLISYGK
jgi:LmbE family N-acetylglucosaminyl deacetylase